MLYQKHRPSTLDEVVGNRSVVLTLRGLLKDKKKCPHAFLFVGPTGTGKTTTARIVARELDCSDANLIEIDTAQFTGIDTVRDIRKSAQFTPLGGGVRVFIIDECFSRGTQIETPTGKRSIEDIQIGDSVYSLAGNDLITNVFTNKITLESIMLLKFDNGSSLYCSKDHLFFTKNGWVKACLLNKNSLLLPFVSKSMVNTNLQLKGEKHEKKEKVLRSMSNTINEKVAKINLFLQLFKSIKRFKTNVNNSYRNARMYYLQETNIVLSGQTGEIQCKNLQYGMWKQTSRVKQSWFKENRSLLQGTIHSPEGVFKQNRTGKITKAGFFTKDDSKQPIEQSISFSQSKRNKKNKWDFAYLASRTWWKWSFYACTSFISNFFRLENGSSYMYREQLLRWFRIPYLLQSRFRKREPEISNRGGWSLTQIEKEYCNRFEENRETEFVRLESSTIYERGNNDEYFRGVIEDQERNQGFVNFYDLEVQKHPSYFTNGLAVHNCHRMTTDAQNAFLKILEDTPPHIYFILCTTNENSLLSTVRGRCSRHQVSLLNEDEMYGLIENTALKEGVSLSAPVLEMVVKSAQGHPRNALTILEQVLATPVKRQLIVAEQAQIVETESIELARALYNGKKWNVVKDILKNLKASDDAESVRRLVLGYATTILLSKEDDRAALMLECFQEPTYNMGFPAIVLNSYQVVKG